ncbi:hypothetical protein DAETH_45420 (plasmid) [Deinococcus aetherius]|uniref:Uncharacterized protein n=1 Tax=Deinococcus aetherius TaxID=200252 RepID=A0ABN6RRL2_9DEIO|nr:hypothetical protein [Deinococcus aetherius]BDP44573.1 hypothetical protein DAETH_45420 [Deinococcus aetherius]
MVLNRWGDFVRPRFPELVLTPCVLGFAFLIAELVSYHHYREGTQIIGFSASILGLVLSLLAFAQQRTLRMVVLALLALLTLSGLYEALEHREARAEDAARFAQRQSAQSPTAASTSASGAAVNSDDGAEAPAVGAPSAGDETGGLPPGFKPGSQIPVLAPLSLSGLAGLTFLALLARRRPDEVTAPSGVAPSTFGQHGSA